jgi:hypothetical protein
MTGRREMPTKTGHYPGAVKNSVDEDDVHLCRTVPLRFDLIDAKGSMQSPSPEYVPPGVLKVFLDETQYRLQ